MKGDMGQVKEREPTLKQYTVQEGDGTQRTKPKGPCAFHTVRVKQISERITESEKPRSNGKRVKTRKVMDSDGSIACTQGSGTTYLYPANTGKVGPELKV